MFTAGFLGVPDSWPLPHFPPPNSELSLRLYPWHLPFYVCACVEEPVCASRPEAKQVLILTLQSNMV